MGYILIDWSGEIHAGMLKLKGYSMLVTGETTLLNSNLTAKMLEIADKLDMISLPIETTISVPFSKAFNPQLLHVIWLLSCIKPAIILSSSLV